MLFAGRLFIISAPTGGGKTTIAKRAFQFLTGKVPLEKVVTYTTRRPRLHEKDGIDYHFISKEDFTTKMDQGFFLETTSYDTNCYGCPRDILNDVAQGKSFILVTDRNGAKTIKKIYPPAVLVWFDVPSLDVLSERLQRRGRETGVELQRRLAIAAQEINAEEREALFDYHFLNDDLIAATTQLVQLIELSLASS